MAEDVTIDKDAIEEEERPLLEALEDEANVQDDTEAEERSPTRFNITSYGADLSVFDLRRRLGTDVLIPAPFQRKYVWTQRQASRFIESILMGLPIPGIFLFLKDKKQLIVDGQQRLITLDRFVSGTWDRKKRKQGASEVEVVVPFKLLEVAEPWSNLTFEKLTHDDQNQILNFLIHATIFRQDSPPERDRSIYEVFDRINTGGLRLSHQEIRTCVSHGEFIKGLERLASNETWRGVYGKRSPRMKDEELILRFFALRDRLNQYARPMSVFLDNYLEDRAKISRADFAKLEDSFLNVLSQVVAALGERPFRPENAINAAVFDSVMLGAASRVSRGPIKNPGAFRDAYERLLVDHRFQASYKRATADAESVKNRIRLATTAFAAVP